MTTGHDRLDQHRATSSVSQGNVTDWEFLQRPGADDRLRARRSATAS